MDKNLKYSKKKKLDEKAIRKILNKMGIAFLSMSIITNFLPKSTYTNPGVNYNSNFVVAHAGGAMPNINGKMVKYLNCIEAFYHYYNQGTRMFEYDLCLSSDGKLIGSHHYEHLPEYNANNKILYSEYEDYKLAGLYTGITEETLLELIQTYEDCIFIIDTKEKKPIDVYDRLLKVSNQKDIEIKNNVMPLVFSEQMLNDLKERCDFQNYMLTTYKNRYSNRYINKILNQHPEVKFLHIQAFDFLKIDIDSINKKGVRVFAHMSKNYNNPLTLNYGCTGIFSNDISENEFKSKYYTVVEEKLTQKNCGFCLPKESDMFYFN